MRKLYLVCYDVSHQKRLYKIHKEVKAFAVGGQKSFYECWLTDAELQYLRNKLESIFDEVNDRIHFFQLDPRMEPQFLGNAHNLASFPFLIV